MDRKIYRQKGRLMDRLISESNERWMREEQVIDDTTVCVAFLGSFQANAAASATPASPIPK